MNRESKLFLVLLLAATSPFVANQAYGDETDIQCSRHYRNTTTGHAVEFDASSPCCTGEPKWIDCLEQNGFPTMVSDSCSFGKKNLAGNTWKCEINKTSTTPKKVPYIGDDQKAQADWLKDINQVMDSHDTPVGPIQCTLASPAPVISSTPDVAQAPAVTDETTDVSPDKSPDTTPVASNDPSKFDPPILVETPVPSIDQPSITFPVLNQTAAPKPAPRAPVITKIKDPAKKPVIVSAPAKPKVQLHVNTAQVGFIGNTHAPVIAPTIPSISSGASAEFQQHAANFSTHVTGIFAHYLNGLEKVNGNRSALMWYGGISKDANSIAVGTEQVLQHAEESSSVVQLGLDGYTPSLLDDLKQCPGDGVNVSAKCKNLMLWKKEFKAHSKVTVYVRPFAEMNLSDMIKNSSARRKQFADTWNALGKFLEDGPDGAKNIRMLFSPMANWANDIRNSASIPQIEDILKNIDPKYVDSFGFNLYSRPTRSDPLPSFAKTASPWMKMFDRMNSSWGTHKPTSVTETGVSRVPMVAEVMYLHAGSDQSEQSTLKEMTPQIALAVQLAQKGRPQTLNALRASMKRNIAANEGASNVQYVDQLINALTPGNPVYQSWDHKRAQWLKDAFKFAADNRFPLMTYFKEDGKDWDAKKGSETFNTLLSEAAAFRAKSL